MDFTDTKNELNIILGDSGDVTFTNEEKERALKKAWNDPYVVKTVWDTSLSFTSGTYQYEIPSTMTTVKDIAISRSNSATDFPQPIDSDLWDVVDGQIQFANNYIVPTGYTFYVKGVYKLDWNFDTLDTPSMQEYVLSNAGYQTLTLLTHKKANLFLKNDTTMGELIGLKRELRNDMKEARLNLQREYEGT